MKQAADSSKIQLIMHPAQLGTAVRSEIELAMRLIGLAFSKEDDWSEKYGCEYENEIFLMHPYCWCEKEGECPWCTGCGIYEASCIGCNYGATKHDEERLDRFGCDYHRGKGIFARFAPWTLDDKRHYYDPPNFWYKPSNFRLIWYKYIGRDMESNKDEIPSDFLHQIFATHPDGMTLEDAFAKFQSRSEEHSRMFSQLVGFVND